MSVEDDPHFWKWVTGVVIAGATSLWGFRTWLENKFASKHTVSTQLQTLTNEVGSLRSVQAKLFDQTRENEQRAQDRHERLLEILANRE